MAGVRLCAAFVHVLAEAVVTGSAACAWTLGGLMARIRAGGNLLWPFCMPENSYEQTCACV